LKLNLNETPSSQDEIPTQELMSPIDVQINILAHTSEVLETSEVFRALKIASVGVGVHTSLTSNSAADGERLQFLLDDYNVGAR